MMQGVDFEFIWENPHDLRYGYLSTWLSKFTINTGSYSFNLRKSDNEVDADLFSQFY